MRRLLCLGLILLSGCGRSDDSLPQEQRDPVAADALNEPLMTDPDLVNLNQGGAALTGGGPASAEIPPDKRSKDEIDTAMAAAGSLAGDAIGRAPEPSATRAASRLERAVTAPAIAKALGIGTAACAGQLGYSAIWAARLTAPFEIYPRGHAGQSAGTDAPGCRLRVVGFVTPVAPDDVVAFYAARAKAAGLPLSLTREGEDDVLQGTKGQAAYAVAVRQRDDRMTEAMLVTSGL